VFIHFCAVAILFVLAWALPRAVLAPELPAWRLISVTRDNARVLTRRIAFLASIFAGDLFFMGSSRELALTDELISLYTLIAKTIEAALVLALVQGHLWAQEAAGETAGEAAGEAAQDAAPTASETPRR
jgi:hypothetical protein